MIFHDEIELPLGCVQYKFGGGHRGHNGLRDIIQKINHSDFHRIRLGVGRPLQPEQGIADFLLEPTTLDGIIQPQKVLDILSFNNLL